MNSENMEHPEKIFGSAFVNELIKKLSGLILKGNSDQVRLPSFECLTHLLVASPPELMARIEDFVKHMMQMLEDANPLIRQRIYAFMLALVQMRKDVVVASSDVIFPKMSKCLRDPDVSARRACLMFFWDYLTVQSDSESSQIIQLLIPYLEDMMPEFVKNAVLSAEDKQNLQMQVTAFIDRNAVYEKGMQEDEEEENMFDDHEDDETDELEAQGSYTLRKIALRCIVKVFEFLGNPAFSFVKSILEQMFASSDVLVLEAGICVLGSIGNSCFSEIKPTLGKLLTHVMQCAASADEYLK